MEPYDITRFKNIYFLGIGGIGMSALARYFHSENCKVAGYDRTSTALTRKLESEGINIQYIESVEALPQNVELVIVTPAVPSDSKLLNHYRSLGTTMLKRSQVLGLLSHSMHCLAVAGTHGKTTTSTLLAWLMRNGGDDCTAFLGGISVDFGSNFVKGQNLKVVLEADEYDRSFLQLRPDRAILTSMDPDHLDIYGDIGKMNEAYIEFCRLVDRDGQVILHHALKDHFSNWVGAGITTYGIEAGDYRAINLRVEQNAMVFDVVFENECWRDMVLHFPGKHNVENAVAAITVAIAEGISEQHIRNSLTLFKGIKRRFERVYESENKVFIDDYAHHPTELKAAIEAARMFYKDKKLMGIFQPHLYSRTKDFALEFAQALDMLDECIIMDIYPARELPMENVDSGLVFHQMKMKEKVWLKREDIIPYLKGKKIEVLMTLGAGDIDKEVQKINELIFLKNK